MKLEGKNSRIVVMAIFLTISCVLTYYYHRVFDLGTVFTHFFYIPIILASLWWNRRGLVVAIFLATFLVLSNNIFREIVLTTNDYSRAALLIIVGYVVAVLSNQIAKTGETLRESEERLRGFMNSATDGFIVLDSKLNYLDINKAALKITGLTKEEVVGKSITDVEPDIKKTGRYNKYMEVLKTGNPFFVDDLVPHPKFGDIHLSLSAFKVGDRLGITIVDITDQKRTQEELKKHRDHLEQLVEERTKELQHSQEQLVRQEKLTVLGQLAGGVGHELRNPLGAIKNAAYFLNMVLKQPEPEVKETLGILDREVATSERIISSLLGFARPKPPVRRKVDINEVVKEMLSCTTVPENVEVVRQLDESLPDITADPDQLGQVFGNIIRNGIQAIPEDGQLVVKSEVFQSGWVAISFTDTGVGIPLEEQQRVFEPLFTTKTKGIGLGLALTKILVEGHDGTIEVQSEVGKGSTFTVRLPIGEEREKGREIGGGEGEVTK